MGKQSKPKKKADSYGTGKVTPVQIAFLVDCYLSDNGYSQTRSVFRSEASHHFPKSPLQQLPAYTQSCTPIGELTREREGHDLLATTQSWAPKTLLSLAAIVDEYVHLKGQRVMLDQEMRRLELEKYRVQTLLQGMQDAMNAYNIGGNGQNLLPQNLLPALVSSVTEKSPPQSLLSSVTANSAVQAPQMDSVMGSPAGYHLYTNPALRSSTTHIDRSRLSTPVANKFARKRSSKYSSDTQVNAKRSRSFSNQLLVEGSNDLSHSADVVNNLENPLQFSVDHSSPKNNAPKDTTPVQGSSIAKCLFNKASPSLPTNMSVPKTPNLASSSHTDKSVSPLQTSSTATSGDGVTPLRTSTNCILISSETIKVSPVKQLTYYSVERNHCISSPMKTNMSRLNMRDHVKGRLDFDTSDCEPNQGNRLPDDISVLKSDKDGDIFDLDLPNFDVLGVDFSFSELLGDFDPDGDFSGQPAVDSSPSSHSGSPGDTWNTESGAHQVFTKLSSTMTEIFSEKDMNVQGQQAVTSFQSRTKSMKIISPVKSNRSFYSDQEKKDVMN